MKTILITGINGFLGSHLARRLLQNYNIIGIEFSKDNLFRINDLSFPIYISDEESIKKIFIENEIDIIIHTATFYGRNNEDIQRIANSNLFMPFKLLDFAIKTKSKLFINTDTALDRFTSAYALTKKQFQDWLFFRAKEIKSVNIQLEHFYGPGCSSSNFITAMIEKLKSNTPVIDLTAGEQKRDFIFYTDVLDAYELIIGKRNELEQDYSHFEIGSDNLISVKNLLLLMKKITFSNSILNFGAIPYRENEVMESKADTTKIKKFGWNPKVNIEVGLIKTIEESI